jgi:hypothetical protein
MSGQCYRWVVFCWLASAGSLWAASSPIVLNTGGGQPLQTESRQLSLDPLLIQPSLVFNFGFATDEAFAPGTFLDSFTVTIQTTDSQFTAVYLTTDASGTVLAPATPGALAIAPTTVSLGSIAYPPLSPLLSRQSAYAVSALIPSQFFGSSFNVYFDLFDNGDAVVSQGWFSDLRIADIPEPQAWSLLLAAIGLWRFARSRR